MKTLPREFAAAGAGIVALCSVELFTSLSILVAVFAAFGVYGAAKLMIPRTPEDHEIILLADGYTQEQLKLFVEYGQTQARVFRELAASIADPGIKQKVGEVGACLDDIFHELESDPQGAVQRTSVLRSHIEKAVQIVHQYARLEKKRDKLSEVSARKLDELVNVINNVHGSFQEQLQSILDHDLERLEVAVGTLKTVLAYDSTASAVQRKWL